MLSLSLYAQRPASSRPRTFKKLTTITRRQSQFLRLFFPTNLHSAAQQGAPPTRPTHLPLSSHSLTTRSYPSLRGLVTTSPRRRTEDDLKMASDDDYMNFLNKANEDPSAGSVQTASKDQGKKEFKAADKGAEIPQPLVAATKDAFFVSDADEPFVPVSLAWEKGDGLPNEGRCPPPSLPSSPRMVPRLAGWPE